MDAKRFTGPQAGSQKYDILTALSVAGLNGTAGFQTSMLRLVALVTARYNWSRDELTVGQREMARLWSVDERTVKREIKRLTAVDILMQIRPGVRGRVAAYRLNVAEIHRLSQPVWERVGPDYSDRMARQTPRKTSETVVRVDFSTGPKTDAPVPTGEAAPWARILGRLEKLEPGLFRHWFSCLAYTKIDAGVLILRAPSQFLAQYVETHHMRLLLGTAQLEILDLRRVEIQT